MKQIVDEVFMTPMRQLQPVCERDEGVANRLSVYVNRVCILRKQDIYLNEPCHGLDIIPLSV